MNDIPATDSAILRRSLDEPSAFAELFERHASAVGRFAAQRVGAQAAGDVLSETFLVAFRRRASFDHAWESARPWLFGIASRIVMKQRAREAAQWRAVVAAASVAAGSSDGGVHRAEERADAVMALGTIADRVGGLAPRDRETLLLYAWGDLTYEEVAVALGVPVGTVRSRLNRVRRKVAGTDGGAAAAAGQQREEGRDGRLDRETA